MYSPYLSVYPYQLNLTSEERDTLLFQLAATQRVLETTRNLTHEQRIQRDTNLKHLRNIRERLYLLIPNIFYNHLP